MRTAPKAPEKITLEEAMQRPGTTTPKAALAKMNEKRRGRHRYALSPMSPQSAGRNKERARRAKQDAKIAARQMQQGDNA